MQANNKNMKENIKIKNGFQGERSLVMPEMILDLAESDPVLRTLHITDIGYYPHATYHYRERTESINQISYKMGFEDSFYFSRLFSKIVGISPKKYRESKK